MKRNEGGITLVALVVTIVVLLILVGITIVYVFGDNGVFSKAQEAKDKTEQAKQDEQDYFSNVDNTINKYTNGNGGGSGNEGPTISDSSSSNHTATNIDYTWEQINKIAQAIANSNSVDSSTMEVTANIDGTPCTIGVGDIATVKYGEEVRRVRVLGFKHDELVNRGAYGGNHSKASISFEFLDFMTGDTYKSMNGSNTNSGGWASTQMRKDLNGYTTSDDEQSGAIGGLGESLSNKRYIKQVKKQYIATYDDANSVTTCNDYLWLLASSEIVNSGYKSGCYGYAIALEGSQYKYYQGVIEEWNETSTKRVKKDSESGSADGWWIRSSDSLNTIDFGGVLSTGNVSNRANANLSYGVAPGFCI